MRLTRGFQPIGTFHQRKHIAMTTVRATAGLGFSG